MRTMTNNDKLEDSITSNFSRTRKPCDFSHSSSLGASVLTRIHSVTWKRGGGEGGAGGGGEEYCGLSAFHCLTRNNVGLEGWNQSTLHVLSS